MCSLLYFMLNDFVIICLAYNFAPLACFLTVLMSKHLLANQSNLLVYSQLICTYSKYLSKQKKNVSFSQLFVPSVTRWTEAVLNENCSMLLLIHVWLHFIKWLGLIVHITRSLHCVNGLCRHTLHAPDLSGLVTNKMKAI